MCDRNAPWEGWYDETLPAVFPESQEILLQGSVLPRPRLVQAVVRAQLLLGEPARSLIGDQGNSQNLRRKNEGFRSDVLPSKNSNIFKEVLLHDYILLKV